MNPNWGGLYTDSPNWIKKIMPTINYINKYDNKYIQYTTTVVLDQKKILKKPAKNIKN